MEKLRTKIKRVFAPKQRVLKPIYWDNFDVTITELARLFKCTPGCISRWVELKGLARLKNGQFNLRDAVNWLAEHYKQQATIQIRLDAVSQNQLCELLGVSRQSIFNWSNSGLPRNENNTFDVAVVLKWLPRHYKRIYQNLYEEKCRAVKQKGRKQPIKRNTQGD